MKRDRGFTLIEMLIAMTLLSVMVVLLFSSLNIAAESWNVGENKVVQVSKKAVVYQFFKRHLTTIQPVMEEPAQPDAGSDVAVGGQVFRGQRRALRFVAALPAASTRKGLQVFEITADRAEPSTIVVRLSPYQQTEPGEEAPAVVLEHVKDFAFSYFGKKDEASEPVWQEDWMGIDYLPLLIKVRIDLNDGSYWPDMVFPLKITGHASIDITAADSSESIDDSETTVP